MRHRRKKDNKIKKWLEEVRTRPDHEKRRIALVGAGVMTGLVFLLWLTISGPSLINTAQNLPEDVDEITTPTKAIWEDTKKLFNDMKQNIQGLKDDSADIQKNLKESLDEKIGNDENKDAKKEEITEDDNISSKPEKIQDEQANTEDTTLDIPTDEKNSDPIFNDFPERQDGQNTTN